MISVFFYATVFTPRIHTRRSRTRIHTTHPSSLVITLAALAAISRAAAPSESVGAYISAKPPVAVQNTLVEVGSNGLRAPRALRTHHLARSLARPSSCSCSSLQLGVVVAFPATVKPNYYHAFTPRELYRVQAHHRQLLRWAHVARPLVGGSATADQYCHGVANPAA
jgi:hypothetical protein